MAKVICKGTVLQQDISSTLTAVAQIISLTLPDMESETTEVDTLDNTDAGIPYLSTERTEGGSVSGELFLDPALASHKAMLSLLDTPTETDWNIIFADTGATEWAFTGAGFGFGGAVALPEALKGTFSIKLSGLPTFPS